MKIFSRKKIFLFIIAVVSAVICAAGCGKQEVKDEKDVEKTEELTVETVSVDAFKKNGFDDMFGYVETENSGNLNAAAVLVNDEIYVYTDYCEYMSDTEYTYVSNGGKTISVKVMEGADSSSLLADAALSVLTANGEAMDLPRAEEISQQETELCYFAVGEQRKTVLALPEEYKGISIQELIEEPSDIQYPAVLTAGGKCIGVVGSIKVVYVPESVNKSKAVSGIKLPKATPENTAQGLGEKLKNEPEKNNKKYIYIIGAAVLLLIGAAFIYNVLKQKNDISDISSNTVLSGEYKNTSGFVGANTGEISVGKLHNIGKRSNQQDSLGISKLDCGVFAAVADGMGGLADGDRVSQKIIMTMLESCEKIKKMTADNVLFGVTKTVNNAVNAMMGGGVGHAVSGSTLVSVFISGGYFHWVSVGDSRIYLYRSGSIIQLNREHNYESDLMLDAVNGEISFSEVKTHPKRHGLTSFIGMGELRHIDGSIRPIRLCGGDRLVLMSDGVYNTLSEDEITKILSSYADAQEAASALEKNILARQKAKQDNFTAVIINI